VLHRPLPDLYPMGFTPSPPKGSGKGAVVLEIRVSCSQACALNREDVMDHNRWRKQIRDD